MLKKLALATGLFFSFISFSYANCLSPQNDSYLYAGGLLHIDTVTASNSSYRGLSPRLALGYNQNIEGNFDLAGELTAELLSLNISNNSQNDAPSAKVDRSFSASLLPSTMLNDEVRGFLRLGAISSKFEGPNVSTMGAQFGVGFQIAIAKYWDMRGEYDYTAYKSVTGLGNPKVDTFGFGVIRKFDM